MPSSPLAHHFFTMACNNAWANHRLLAACSRLSQDDFVAPRTSFFPSLKATLNHNLTVDWYYVDALERALRGEPPNREVDRFFEPEEPFDDLRGARRRRNGPSIAGSIAACAALTDADLAGPIAGAAARGHHAARPRRGSSRICSSTRSTIAARRTRCSPARPSSRRSSTNSSARTKRICARPSSPRSGLSEAAIWGEP